MKLCAKCGNYVPDELLKCEKCGTAITLTKEQFLESHTVYQKRCKMRQLWIGAILGGILGSAILLLFTILMSMTGALEFIPMYMKVPPFIVGVLCILLTVFSIKKLVSIKKFGDDEYEKYLNSLK